MVDERLCWPLIQTLRVQMASLNWLTSAWQMLRSMPVTVAPNWCGRIYIGFTDVVLPLRRLF